jgi:glycosyltransferase involved in cell wall biosynthesis
VQAMTKLNNLDQIICIDDGSTDGTADLVAREFSPKVSVFRLEENQGKATAVAFAARRTDCEYILLVDADLRRVNCAEFETAINAVKDNPDVDMLVLRRVNQDTYAKLFRGDTLITGERIVRRSDLLDLYEQRPLYGYELEVALNQYMMDNHKNVRWLPISAISTVSTRKWGFRDGMKMKGKMIREILDCVGARGFLNQWLTFGRKRLD